MNFFEPVLIGLDQLRTHKLRASLSILGILISVGSVTGIVSIGEGLQTRILGEFDRMGGSSLISVSPPEEWYRSGNGWVRRNWEEYLTDEDVEAIRESTPQIKLAIPLIESNGIIRYRDVSISSKLYATTEGYREVDNLLVEKGRFFSTEDIRNANKIAILGADLAKDIFGKEEPVGKELKLGGIRYTVVGVVVRKRALGDSDDRYIAVPFTTVQMRVSGNNHISMLVVKTHDPAQVDEVVHVIHNVLRRSHEHAADFQVETAANQLEQFNRVMLIMKLIAGGIAGISLIVGGIGIMNIMLVSVAERTREIGIRMALGAKRRSILGQFILESITLCLAGGILGVILGLGIGAGISAFATHATHQPFESAITPGMMLFAVLYSSGVGLFFGVYPAYRASRLDPVEALRYE